MNNKKSGNTRITEADLIDLLASLKQEPSREANFEDRFIHDFRERVAQYAVTRPARRVLWEHILCRLANVRKRSWVCSATTLGVGVLGVAFYSFSSDTAISPATPTVGAARVYQKLTPADKQELIMSSTLSLESTTCVSTDDYTAQQFAAYSQPGFSMADQVQKQAESYYNIPSVERRFYNSRAQNLSVDTMMENNNYTITIPSH